MWSVKYWKAEIMCKISGFTLAIGKTKNDPKLFHLKSRVLQYTFFYKKPVYKKPVLKFFSELGNRVLMFQEHKKLAGHYSKKRRVYLKKWHKSR